MAGGLRRGASLPVMQQRWGYAPGPTPHRHPGDHEGRSLLIGHPPVVMTYEQHDGWRGRFDDAVGKTWIFIAVVIWIILPTCGGLALILR